MSGEKQIETQVLNSWVSLVETHSADASYYHLKVPDYVTCVAISPEGRVPLVKQNRVPLGRESIELPGGLIDSEITPLECAERELNEEVGISNITLVHSFPPFILDSGRIENKSWIFVFEFIEQDFAPTEAGIEVIWVGISELLEMALAGKIDHLGHIAAIVMCKHLGVFDKFLVWDD
jgi:ADP-ribose pyrophosphatase